MTSYCSQPLVTDTLHRREQQVREHLQERALRRPSASSPANQGTGILTRLSALLPRRVPTPATEGR